jgi:glycosyltransferase involved in cell wall biosynthesis
MDPLKRKRAHKTKQYGMIFNKGFLFYAEFNTRLFWTLLKEKKSLLYANDLDTLLPNYLAAKISRTPLVYDSHEYFTEVPELQNRSFVKSIWEKLEAWLFPRLNNVITVNHKLAEIYSKKYNVPVTVIRNVPRPIQEESLKTVEETVEKSHKESKQILIYQGALNLGRGIELMIDCMEFLPDVELLIVGQGDISGELKMRVKNRNLSDSIHFLGRVNPKELKKLTPNASIGFSLEEDLGLNYRYALPNKIFDYIHAGIPVIVSDLPIMSKLVLETGIGEVLKERNPRALADLVREVLLKQRSYEKNLYTAARKFNWNEEKKVFQKFIDRIDNLE